MDSLKFFENVITPGQEDKLRKYETILGAEKQALQRSFFTKRKSGHLTFSFSGILSGKNPQREIRVMVRILFEDLYEGHVDNREAFLISHLFD